MASDQLLFHTDQEVYTCIMYIMYSCYNHTLSGLDLGHLSLQEQGVGSIH